MIIVGLMVGAIFGMLTTVGVGTDRFERRARQSTCVLFVADQDGRFLGNYRDPGVHGHPHLRLFLLGRQEMGWVAGMRLAHRSPTVTAPLGAVFSSRSSLVRCPLPRDRQHARSGTRMRACRGNSSTTGNTRQEE